MHEDEQAADGLTFAHDLVPDILDELNIKESSRAGQQALTYARRYGYEESIGRAPSSVAAGAVYLAGKMHSTGVTQSRVSAAAGVAPVTIRHAYVDIATAEGIEIAANTDAAGEGVGDASEGRGLRDRLKGGLFAYLRGES